MTSMQFSLISFEGVSVLVYRDDLNHGVISGNKLHKLTPNIKLAKAKNCSAVLSFGGPYSNHLHALAWASKDAGIKSIGVVRGELQTGLTPTLKDCKKWGMHLQPSQRKDYREYQELLSSQKQPCFANELNFPWLLDSQETTLVIPEGGSNAIAIDSITQAYRQVVASKQCRSITHALCATGTGATLAGLYQATPAHIKTIGIQAVSEGDATLKRISRWINEKPSRLSIQQGHLSGFGKTPIELKEFIEFFEDTYNIPLDPIYNGKAMFKLFKMISAGKFRTNDKILFIHTGGLQGKRNVGEKPNKDSQ